MRFLVVLMMFFASLGALEWGNDYGAALAKAKKEKKDVYLFLGSEYCKYCEKLKKEVLEKSEVQKRLEKSFVLLYLSRDIDDIPAKFEVKPVPRHYFLTSDGQIIYTTIGGRTLDGFNEMLNEVEDSKKN